VGLEAARTKRGDVAFNCFEFSRGEPVESEARHAVPHGTRVYDPIGTHEVSSPEASSFGALMVPAGQAVHTLDLTYSFTAHSTLIPTHEVSAPEASSFGALMVPAGQAVHTLDLTYSFTALLHIRMKCLLQRHHRSVSCGGLRGRRCIRWT